jgi:high-affinity nickel permease
MIGYLIIAVFAASWIVSFVVYRWKGYDDLAVEIP